jgi:hypothetical protein
MSADAQKSDDPYAGFNDHDYAYDLGNVYEDAEFLRAVARSSHSRRPVRNTLPIKRAHSF